MSANNIIEIRETFKGAYSVGEYDADTGGMLEFVGSFGSLEEAVKEAKLYEKKIGEEGFEVEYGIQVK
jgi:hypothetical protein